MWFVNPKGGDVLGQPVYPSLADLPGAPDLVDVFRRAEDLPAVAAEVVAIDGIAHVLGPARAAVRRGGGHRPRQPAATS